MAFAQTRDVLDHVKQFHRMLGEYYERLKGSTEEPRARTLLDHMSRHENHLADCLADYETLVSKNVLDTYFKYESESTVVKAIAELQLRPGMRIEDVTAAAKHMGLRLMAFYREMAGRAVSLRVREVFENLLEMEQREQIELSKQLLDIRSL